MSAQDSSFAKLAIDMLSRGRSLQFKAHGASMTPFVRDGDVLTVVPTSATQLRLGDIALYTRPDRKILIHRLTGIASTRRGTLFRFSGDARPDIDEIVAAGNILGKVVSITRNSRSFHPSRYSWRLASSVWHTISRASPALLQAISRIRKSNSILTSRRFSCTPHNHD